MEIRQAYAVCAQERVLETYSLLCCSLKHDGCCTIAEEDTCLAVLVVDDRRHLLGSDDHDTLIASALYECACHIHGIEESAACAGDIESMGICKSELTYHD